MRSIFLLTVALGACGGGGGGAADAGHTTPDADSGGGPPDAQAPPAAFQAYLGSTHAHSIFSFDTKGDAAPAAFAAAKAAGADFFAITDHVDAPSGSEFSPAQYLELVAMADAATDASFVAIPGFEFHLDENEVNTFGVDLTDALIDESHVVAPPAYLDRIAAVPGAFGQWNHPARDGMNEFDEFAGYNADRDVAISLVEVLNGDDDPFAASYQKALDAGWHVGPTAGHDTHGGPWMTLPTRTGVLATSLTREHLFDALRDQRVYATQDPAQRIWYSLNDSIMGTTIAPASSYRVAVRVQGGEDVETIEIVSNGGEVVTSGAPTDGEWTVDLAAQPGRFYYARLTGADGAMAWTAPIWVTRPE